MKDQVEKAVLVFDVRVRMAELRSMADKLCVAFEAQERELLAERASLDAAADLIKKNAADLGARELKVARREQEVQNIRQIAADRKAQLETAHQNVDAADAVRRKAEVNQRIAEVEKTKLEETVALLLKDKKALAAERDKLRDSLNVAQLLARAEQSEAEATK